MLSLSSHLAAGTASNSGLLESSVQMTVKLADIHILLQQVQLLPIPSFPLWVDNNTGIVLWKIHQLTGQHVKQGKSMPLPQGRARHSVHAFCCHTTTDSCLSW